MRISDWSSDVCSSDLARAIAAFLPAGGRQRAEIAHQQSADTGRAAALMGGDDHEIGMIDRRSIGARGHLRGIDEQQPTRGVDDCGKLGDRLAHAGLAIGRSEEHTSELQSLMRISYAVFCLKKHST